LELFDWAHYSAKGLDFVSKIMNYYSPKTNGNYRTIQMNLPLDDGPEHPEIVRRIALCAKHCS